MDPSSYGMLVVVEGVAGEVGVENVMRLLGDTTDRYGLNRVRRDVGVLVARLLVVRGGSVVVEECDCVVLEANAG